MIFKWTSRIRAGERFKAWKIFITPEEINRPPVLVDLQTRLAVSGAPESKTFPKPDGFVGTVVDPYLNALHAGLVKKNVHVPQAIRIRWNALIKKAMENGSDALDADMRQILLDNAETLLNLHLRVWRAPGPKAQKRLGNGRMQAMN